MNQSSTFYLFLLFLYFQSLFPSVSAAQLELVLVLFYQSLTRGNQPLIHHLNILVGIGENNGMYDNKTVIKFGLPLTIIIIIVVLFQALWWQSTSLI